MRCKVEFKLHSFLLDVLFLSYPASEESQRSAEDSSLTPLLTFQVKSPTNKVKSTRETEGKSGEEKEEGGRTRASQHISPVVSP